MDGRFEIGCHNCEYLQTEVGAIVGGCVKHTRIVWPDTDEILICHDFRCRHELCSQPGFENLDKIFAGKFRNHMKSGKLYSYLPHGANPVLTVYSFAGGPSQESAKSHNGK